MLLSTLVDEFLDYETVQVALGNHSERTHMAYIYDLRHLYSVLGPVEIKKINADTVQAYYLALSQAASKRTGKPFSPHTINKLLRTFRRLLNFAVSRGWLDNPPAIELVKAEVDLEKKTIPVEKLQKILEYAYTKRLNRERDTFIVVALSDFGPRVSEIASLAIPNVNEAARQVTIRRKGGRVQTVPVSEVFLGAYRLWMRARPLCAHKYVLCGTNNAAHPSMTAAAVGQAFRRMSISALGESWGPHSVRHMWISEMMNNTTTPIKVIQDIAGHKSIKTTEKYAKEDLSAQQRAIEENRLLQVDLDQVDIGNSEDREMLKSGPYVTMCLN